MEEEGGRGKSGIRYIQGGPEIQEPLTSSSHMNVPAPECHTQAEGVWNRATHQTPGEPEAERYGAQTTPKARKPSQNEFPAGIRKWLQL